MADRLRQLSDERFRIEAQLGSGGSGTVYRAFDRARSETIALKLLTNLEADALFRFKGEFRQLARIAHPNLMQLHELGARGDQWFLSMELIDGTDFVRYVRHRDEARDDDGDDDTLDRLDTQAVGTLPPENDSAPPSLSSLPPAPRGGARLGGRGVLDVERLRAALPQLHDGLHALHLTGRVHRDLKPANVLVARADGRVVIGDFGLVTRVTEPQKTGRAKPGEKAIAGTPAYMAPEQMVGGVLTPATDWYAVGQLLFVALTGYLPFDVSLPWPELLRARLKGPPIDPRALAPEAPPDLAELALALMHPEPQERPDSKRIVAMLRGAARASSPSEEPQRLVGRDPELALLQQAFARARGGDCTLALVSGRSGMGKSALTQHFLDDARTRHDAIVLASRCYEREDLPYKAIDPLMDELSTVLLQLDRSLLDELPGLPALMRMFPVLQRVRGRDEAQPPSGARDPVEQKREAFGALRELCRRLARIAPLVLYIDDLQWGDLDSAPVLLELLRAPRAPALLMLCAFRAEDAARSPLLGTLRESQLGRAGIAAPLRVEVAELDPAAAQALARDQLRGCPGAEEAAPLVVQEARGSPFFVRELASYVRTHGLAAARHMRLESVLEQTLAALPAESRTLLSVIAAAGRPERRAIIDAAADLGARAQQAYRALEALQLVHGVGAGSDGSVEASHDRIREAAYRSLSDDERARHHEALARALEQQAGASVDPGLLLEHHRAAGDHARAAHYALRAAEHAESLLAYERAAGLYQQAMALRETSSDERRLLEERFAFAAMMAGQGVAAAEAFFRAIPGATEERATELHSLATAQLLRSGLVARAFDELARAEHLLAMPTPTSTLRAVGMLLWRRLRIRLRGLKLRGRTGPLPAQLRNRMDLLWSIASALSPIDQLRGGVYQAEHLLLALRSGDQYRFARALAIEASTYATANRRPQRTQWILDRGLEIGGASREPHALSAVIGLSGVCRMLEGRFLEAIRLCRQTREIVRVQLHGTLAWDRVAIEHFELRALAQVGRVHELVERVPESLRDADARGDRYATVSLRTSHCCWAWLGPDLPEVAREQVALAERDWTQEGYHLQHWYTTQAVASIALYQRDVEAARARLAREWRAMLLIRKKIQFTRAEMLYMRARLDLMAARQRGDRALLAGVRKDADALLREGPPWIVAHGRLLHAALASFDSAERAAALLYEVEGQLEAVDMKLHASVCARRRGELLGGAEGRRLVEQADRAIIALGVQRPEAFADLLAPGFAAGAGDVPQSP